MRAFVVEHHDAEVRAAVRDVDEAAWLDGPVEVAVEWSCLNAKDAMVRRPNSRVARRSPLIAGVDAAGTVTASAHPSVRVGTRVVVHGHGLGTSHHGGLAPRLRCDASWVVEVPDSMSTRAAMAYGTAGYTAMASVRALRAAGIAPGDGEVLVTGATGGVGSIAVALLAAAGYDVTAMSGSAAGHGWLRRLGAARVVGRDDLDVAPDRVLAPERLAGAIDCVGGATLAGILRSVRWGGVVAASGLVGGAALQTTVYPFITRNVALLGIDAVDAPADVRAAVWRSLDGALDPGLLDELVDDEISLDAVADGLDRLDAGDVRGRIIVDPTRR